MYITVFLLLLSSVFGQSIEEYETRLYIQLDSLKQDIIKEIHVEQEERETFIDGKTEEITAKAEGRVKVYLTLAAGVLLGVVTLSFWISVFAYKRLFRGRKPKFGDDHECRFNDVPDDPREALQYLKQAYWDLDKVVNNGKSN
jgi:hypothetical protein